MPTKPITRRSMLGLSAAALSSLMFAGCASEGRPDGAVEVEIVSYKQEAKSIFDQIQADFNKTHDRRQAQDRQPGRRP